MKRVAQFLRSVLPADLFQVCFLAGLVCFTIAPHLLWWPGRQNDNWSVRLNASPEPIGSYALQVAAGYGFLLVSSAGYFFCLWPRKRPAWKVGLLVLLPAVLSTGATLAKFLSIRAGGYSVPYHARSSNLGFSRVVTEVWLAGAGMQLAVFGIFLAGIFWIRLLSGGRSRLPVTLGGDGTIPDMRQPAWEGAKRLMWFATAPLGTVLTALLVLPVLLLLSRATKGLSDNEWVWMDWLQKLIAALVALGLALLLAGRDNRKSLWSSCKLPEPTVIIVAAALPVFVTLLAAVAHFLVNRAHWAANDFGKYSPPELLNYLPRPAIWMVGLVFGAFVEEVIFRGVLQQHFVQRYGVWPGIFLVGAVWAAIHFYSDMGLSDTEIALRLLHRIVACVVLGIALSWLTLRFGSLIPATLAHWLSNVGIFSAHERAYPGSEWNRTLVWLLVVLVLYRFWPLPQPEREESRETAADAQPASA